jgi:hypothetical protein
MTLAGTCKRFQKGPRTDPGRRVSFKLAGALGASFREAFRPVLTPPAATFLGDPQPSLGALSMGREEPRTLPSDAQAEASNKPSTRPVRASCPALSEDGNRTPNVVESGSIAE